CLYRTGGECNASADGSVPEPHSGDGPASRPDEPVFVRSLVKQVLDLAVELDTPSIAGGNRVPDHEIGSRRAVELEQAIGSPEEREVVMAFREDVERRVEPWRHPLGQRQSDGMGRQAEDLEIVI